MVKRINNVENNTTEDATLASALWTEIKDKKIEMFSLPNQTVSNYFTPISADPSKLYLTYKVSSALPALETALGSAFKVELADKYVIISKVS